MKIKTIELYKYKKFQSSNIKRLKLDIEDDVQIILGSNGSGKSSFLQHVLPNVPTKSEFEKQGYKYLNIEHHGNIYELTFDTSSHSKFHSFKINGQELNEGKSALIQEELIRKHFGLTKNIDKILRCEIDICSLSPAIRKELFFDFNPIDISLFQSLHKSIRKEHTKIKNIMSELYKRKQQLLSEKISDQEFDKITKRIKELNDYNKELLDNISCVKVLMNELEDIQVDQDRYQDLKNKFFRVLKKLRQLHFTCDNNIDNIKNKIQERSNLISSYKTSLEHISKESQNLSEEIDKYDTILKNSNKEDQVEILNKQYISLEQSIHEKQKLYKELFRYIQTNLQKYNIQIEEIIHVRSFMEKWLNELMNILEHFQHVDFRFILSRKTLEKNKEIFHSLKDKYHNLEVVLNTHKNQLQDLLLTKSKISSSKIPVQLDCKKCSLYLAYIKDVNDIQSKINNLQNKISTIEKEYQKLKTTLNKLNDIISVQTLIHQHLVELKTHFAKLGKVKQLILDGIDVKKILISSYYNLYKKIEYQWQNISLFLEYEKEKQLKEEIHQELLKTKKSQSSNIQLIQKIRDEKYQRWKSLTQKTKELEYKIIDIENELSILSKKLEYINIIFNIQSEFDEIINNYEIYYKKQFYHQTLDILLEYSTKINKEIIELQEYIKNQEFIRERLNKEILEPLQEYEKNKKIIEIIENALKDISIEYIRSFLNEVIELMNEFLASFFTYPLVIQYVESNQDIDFTFPVRVKDVLVSDISKCSTGQKDAIKFVFSLAMIILLDLKSYPLLIDEIDRAFDEQHKLKFIDLCNQIMEKNIVSQLFLVNHHAILYEGFNGNIVVLNDDNILLPSEYNQKVLIER